MRASVEINIFVLYWTQRYLLAKKRKKMVLNPQKLSMSEGQIWSDQPQTLQKLFSKLTSPAEKR